VSQFEISSDPPQAGSSLAAGAEIMTGCGEQAPSTHGAVVPDSERDRLYAAAVESSIHAFIVVELDGTITSWNPAAEQMFGYSAKEAIGKPIELIVPPEDAGKVAEFRAMVQRGEPQVRYEAVRIAKGGRKVNIVATLTPVKAPSGAVIGVCAILSDVTEQRLTEQMFGLAVESCPSGMIMSDPDGTIIMTNSATERLFGYDHGELLGQSIEILVPERLRERHRLFRHAFGAGPAASRRSRQMQGRRKDASEVAVEIALNTIQVDGRQVVLSVISDDSERQQIEEMKDEFIATVSHELRTPLTSIIGSLGLLLGGAAGPQTPAVTKLVSLAHANSQRLVRLINDMLDIEKIESGQVAFDFQVIDLRALVEHAIEANQDFAKQYHVQIRLDPDSTDATVRVDSDRIIQVLTNLLSNACKFSPTGSDVVIKIEPRDPAVRISVRDHGPGIPDDFKSRIFGKFAQADGCTTRQKSGSGLGLNIAKQIVARQGGQIGFDAAPGGGTVFHVDLPVVVAADTAPSAEAERIVSPRAMLCSSDLELLATLTGVLHTRGMPVDVVPTVKTAIASAERFAYSVVFIDLSPRDIDGVGLIRELRASSCCRATPIVAVVDNAAGLPPDLRYNDLKIEAWLAKPADRERLDAILGLIGLPGTVRPCILHVEDDDGMQQLVARRLQREFDIIPARSIEQAREKLASGRFHAALLDLTLPDGLGTDLLASLQDRSGTDIPVVVHSGYSTDPQVCARSDAVIAKSHTSISELAVILRRIVSARSNPASSRPAAT
jgi:PAS domain S-box-containing protein